MTSWLMLGLVSFLLLGLLHDLDKEAMQKFQEIKEEYPTMGPVMVGAVWILTFFIMMILGPFGLALVIARHIRKKKD